MGNRTDRSEQYSNATVSTQAAPGALASQYSTWAALSAAVAAIQGASLVDLGEDLERRPQRVAGFPSGEGVSGKAVRVDVYAVDNGIGNAFSVEYIGQAQFTLGTEAVVNGPANHVWCSGGDVVSSGYLEANSGFTFKAFGTGATGSRRGFAISDLCNAKALILVPAKGASNAATSAACTNRVWN